MRSARWTTAGVLAGLLAVSAGLGFATDAAALEGDGLNVPAGAGPWSRWQARVSFSTSASPAWRSLAGASDHTGLKLRGLSLMGDYYFGTMRPVAPASGFRATSGLVVGARSSLSLADTAANGLAARGLSLDRRGAGLLAMPTLPGIDPSSDPATVPYVGIGYSGASAKGGWGFSADLGLVAMNPGSAVKLGRVFSGTQSLDEMLRDLRLSPVLQLGVSYSF